MVSDLKLAESEVRALEAELLVYAGLVAREGGQWARAMDEASLSARKAGAENPYGRQFRLAVCCSQQEFRTQGSLVAVQNASNAIVSGWMAAPKWTPKTKATFGFLQQRKMLSEVIESIRHDAPEWAEAIRVARDGARDASLGEAAHTAAHATAGIVASISATAHTLVSAVEAFKLLKALRSDPMKVNAEESARLHIVQANFGAALQGLCETLHLVPEPADVANGKYELTRVEAASRFQANLAATPDPF